MKYTVLLKGDTCGTLDSNDTNGVDANTLIGKRVTVHLTGHSGLPIEKEGILEEILEENEDYSAIYRSDC